MSDFKTQIIKGVSWSAVQRLGSQAVQFGVFLLLARLLDPQAFGLLSLALVYVMLVQIFVEQGFGDAIIQRKELDGTYLSTAFWANLLSGILFCGIGWLSAGLVARIFGQPALAPILQWLSLLFPINALTVVPQCLLRRGLEFKSLALRSIVQFTAGGGVAVFMAFRGYGIWSLVGQQLVTALIGLVMLWGATPWRPSFHASKACFKELLWFGSNICGVNLLNLINRQADNLIIGYFLGPVALGYYAIAYQILVNVSNLLVGTINNLALPLLARLQHDREQFVNAIYRMTSLTCAVSAPLFFGISVLAPETVQLCFGSKWDASVPSMQVLFLIGLLYAGFYFHGPILTAIGKPQWNLLLNAIQAVTNCVAFAIGVHWGILGVAAAYVLRAYLMAPLQVWILQREAGVEPGRYYRQFLPAGAASLLMMLTIWVARLGLGSLLPLAAQTALLVLLGAAVYLAAILTFQPELRELLVPLLRRLRRRTQPATTIPAAEAALIP
jgi:PST family polysaccharide transporter